MENRKQAILLIAHNNLEVLKKSLELLDSNYFDLFIHIDVKSKIDYSELKNICKKSNLYFFKEFDLRWGDFKMVECELFLLNQALLQNNNYEYYHLISGTDLPIKKNSEIYNFYNQNYGKEFIHFIGNQIPEQKLDWIKYYYIMRFFKNNNYTAKLNKLFIKIQKILGINRLRNIKYEIMSGSQWFSITDEFCNYLISKSNEIKEIFKNTHIPDEFFVQTILYNSKFKKNLYLKDYNDDYSSCARLIVWKEKDHPYTWRFNDFEEIIQSNCMFARKFEYSKDSKIVERLYNYLKDESEE